MVEGCAAGVIVKANVCAGLEKRLDVLSRTVSSGDDEGRHAAITAFVGIRAELNEKAHDRGRVEVGAGSPHEGRLAIPFAARLRKSSILFEEGSQRFHIA
jgi:hypothetical protein